MAHVIPLLLRLLIQEIQIGFGFTFLVLAHLGSSGQNPESHKTVVVVVVCGWMCVVKVTDKFTCSELRKRFGIDDVFTVVQ